MLWYEVNKGWASLDEEPHPFGFKESLALITSKEEDNKTILSWDMHYHIEDCDSLQITVDALAQTLNEEIAQYLISMFGGRILPSA